MKNTKYILFIISLLLLTSCSGKSVSKVDESQVKEIKVTNFQEFGSNEGDLIKLINDENEINAIIKIISKAKSIKGDVDMADANYNMTIILNDETEQTFHLWLSNETNSTGTIMNINATADAYEMSKKQMKDFQRIFFK